MKEVQPPKKPLLFYYLIALILLLLLNALLFPRLFSTRVSEVDYGTFLTMIENKTIGEVEIDDNEIIFSDNEDPAHYYKTGKLEDGDKLADRLYNAGITSFSTPIVQQTSPILSFLLSWIFPVLFFVAIGQLLSRSLAKKMGGGIGLSLIHISLPRSAPK